MFFHTSKFTDYFYYTLCQNKFHISFCKTCGCIIPVLFESNLCINKFSKNPSQNTLTDCCHQIIQTLFICFTCCLKSFKFTCEFNEIQIADNTADINIFISF